MVIRLIKSKETPTVFCTRAWCPKCMTSVILQQPNPLTAPLLMQCESCGTQQDASATELREACTGITANTIAERKAKRKKG